MRISIISVSCCNPAMKLEDQEYQIKVRDALAEAKLEAQVKIITISEATSVLSLETINKMRPLLDRYGFGFLPAMLIDDELVLYGGVPTMEKISEVIDTYGRPYDGAEFNGKIVPKIGTEKRGGS
jgi:hypothetical protein